MLNVSAYIRALNKIHMLQDTLSVKVTRTTHSRLTEVDWNNLPFGKIFSDHMLVMDYKDGEWQGTYYLPDLHGKIAELRAAYVTYQQQVKR